ncbi:Xaa-Pro peptidase family protein [Sinanaerobacter sp. ZZT-01]|uniref:M24 family metallopeptidase n=1 Tax=Sinanaerobacter sp. ZZT-01 TaxID=3111540 RepID=UPI002D788B98|nr:Xaa-Pro peptidase family protein [Sinanaerobacter sp. ZZT-01]WRR93147.1 Xaa-Pro peptidase family protein [Sinanaerobacter sp. ZZT-01]
MENKSEKAIRISNRITKVRNALKEQQLDAIWITKKENQIYLCDFPSSNCYLLLTKYKNYLLTDFRYIEAAKETCPMYEIVLIDNQYSEMDFLKEMQLSVIGIENDILTVNSYRKLKKNIQNVQWQDCSGLVEGIRLIKDEYELNAVKQAASLTDDCFTHMLTVLKPGMTEKEAALEIEFYFKKNGAMGLSFDSICVSGIRSSLPHGVPTEKKIEPGDLLTMDFGCILDGYCSDMTRTVAIGSVTKEQKQIYNLVLEAQKSAIEGLKPGITYAEGDRLARQVISDAGYGDYFGHGLGHGVGLEIHEAPTLSPRGKGILKENMTVTIEPGIYLPQKFGIRIEDLAIITSFGIINTVHSEKELIII